MATLSDGRTVHMSRIQDGDLHDQIGEKLKVANQWVKEPIKGKKKK